MCHMAGRVEIEKIILSCIPIALPLKCHTAECGACVLCRYMHESTRVYKVHMSLHSA